MALQHQQFNQVRHVLPQAPACRRCATPRAITAAIAHLRARTSPLSAPPRAQHPAAAARLGDRCPNTPDHRDDRRRRPGARHLQTVHASIAADRRRSWCSVPSCSSARSRSSTTRGTPTSTGPTESRTRPDERRRDDPLPRHPVPGEHGRGQPSVVVAGRAVDGRPRCAGVRCCRPISRRARRPPWSSAEISYRSIVSIPAPRRRTPSSR